MSPRSTAPASRASIGARPRRRARSASPICRRCATSSSRRRVRRIIPPLLNDFIGLQKDTALVNVIGTIDAFNQSKIIASNHFNLSAVTTVAILFIVITIPQARFVDRLIERDRRRMRAGAEMRADAMALIEIRDIHKRFGAHRGLQRPRPRGRGASGRLPDRPLGLRQVDAAALHQRARDDRRRRDPHPRRPGHRARRRRQRAAPRRRHRLPELQPVPAHDGARERHARARRRCCGRAAREAEATGHGAADAHRPRAQGAANIPTGSRAASSSASPSSARSPWARW